MNTVPTEAVWFDDVVWLVWLDTKFGDMWIEQVFIAKAQTQEEAIRKAANFVSPLTCKQGSSAPKRLDRILDTSSGLYEIIVQGEQK